MERKNEERMTPLMKEHQSELKRVRSDNGDGSVNDRHRTNGGDDYGRANKRSRGRNYDERENNKKNEERKAANRLKWEKRLENKLDKPGDRWTTRRAIHDPDEINWGGYCHTHGYDPIRLAHNSAKCFTKSNNHDKTATRTNRKGGSESKKPL